LRRAVASRGIRAKIRRMSVKPLQIGAAGAARQPMQRTPRPGIGPDLTRLKALKRQIIDRHARPDNLRGLAMVLTTLLPIAALFALVPASAELSYALTGCIALLTSLFLLRAFVLMHECGHGSLFRSARLNRGFGFVFGVVAGMPQYVWSQHHQYHHANNGNWQRYAGPLNIISVHEYAAMSAAQQRRYRNARSLWLAPFAGFLYLIVNPRLNWLKGSLQLLLHLARAKLAQPAVSLREHARGFKTPLWTSAPEYWHMFWNNVVLLALWAVLAWLIGPALFFAFYVASVSLAGAAGIVVFTVQHNFEHSYASGDAGWDYHRAAIEGTSFLQLPSWLNWFTANIAYHHVHHLSARIPSYRLAACHAEYAALFAGVTRIGLAEIPRALRCILWDTQAQRLVADLSVRT
jgi:omega-6 fatty acid desaturase (delta-12 desaturase)